MVPACARRRSQWVPAFAGMTWRRERQGDGARRAPSGACAPLDSRLRGNDDCAEGGATGQMRERRGVAYASLAEVGPTTPLQ